jgi:hypothetical protein
VGQEFSEYFGVLREGVAWFSDPGQGGPADNVLQVRVRAVRAAMDAGVSPTDAGAMPWDSGLEEDSAAEEDSGAGHEEDAGVEDAFEGDVRASAEGGRRADSAIGGSSGEVMGGCGCVVVGRSAGRSGGWSWAALGALAAIAMRSSTRRPRR